MFADIASEWAEFENAKTVNSSLDRVDEITAKARECLMVGYGILCLQITENSVSSAALLCSLLTRFCYLFVYSADCPELKDSLYQMKCSISLHISKFIQTFVLLVEEDMDVILTSAIQSIVNITDSQLSWTRINNSWCFESGNCGTHYCVNILDGYFLINGIPPGRLPKDILSNSLYKRCFKERDFEVSNHQGLLRTKLFDDHYYYEFGMNDGKVIIRETDQRTGCVLELCDFTDDICWNDVPIRLIEMFSHWVCFDKNVVLFRGVDFNDRSIEAFANLLGDKLFIFNHQIHSAKNWMVLNINIAIP